MGRKWRNFGPCWFGISFGGGDPDANRFILTRTVIGALMPLTFCGQKGNSSLPDRSKIIRES